MIWEWGGGKLFDPVSKRVFTTREERVESPHLISYLPAQLLAAAGGAATFGALALVCGGALIFVRALVAETRSRTPEQIRDEASEEKRSRGLAYVTVCNGM